MSVCVNVCVNVCVRMGLLTICGLVNSQHAVCKMKVNKFEREREREREKERERERGS